MQPPSPSRAPRIAVLSLGSDLVEWCGESGHASVPVQERTAEEYARAALAAAQAAGAKPGRCILALGDGVIEQRTLTLPILARSELGPIFLRKAAALLEVAPAEALYAALPQMTDAGNAADAAHERKWFLVASRRKFMLDLRLALRTRGFRVKRVVAARLARLCHADELRGDSASAAIVIDVEPDGVVVSLIAQGTLVHQNRMQGSFETLPSMAFSLIQEVKSFEASWRKLSRGESIAHLVVLGIEPERSLLFVNGLANAMPQARALVLPGAASTPEEIEQALSARAAGRLPGRIASVSSCASEGSYNLDLTVHVPARYSYVATLAACLLLVTGGVGTYVRNRLGRQVEEHDVQTAALHASARQLEKLRHDNERASKLVSDLDLECDRLVAAGAVGMPLEAALEQCATALERRAVLTSFASEYDDGYGEVRIGGVTDPSPVSAMHSLTDLSAELEQSTVFENVSMDAPMQRSDDIRGARAPLLFEVNANWETPE